MTHARLVSLEDVLLTAPDGKLTYAGVKLGTLIGC